MTTELTVEIATALSRLLADAQVRGVIVGEHFREWFPTSQTEVDAARRVEAAGTHPAAEPAIIDGLRSDLDHQAELLAVDRRRPCELRGGGHGCI